MKTTEEILKRITELKADERLSYPCATIFGNAPLALIQMSLETELHTLERVMELPRTQIPIKTNKTHNGVGDGKSKIRK